MGGPSTRQGAGREDLQGQVSIWGREEGEQGQGKYLLPAEKGGAVGHPESLNRKTQLLKRTREEETKPKEAPKYLV